MESRYHMALTMLIVSVATAPTFPPDPVRVATAAFLGLIIGFVMHRRMQDYRVWAGESRPWRLARVALDGVIGGLIATAYALIVVRLRSPELIPTMDLPMLLILPTMGVLLTGTYYLTARCPDMSPTI